MNIENHPCFNPGACKSFGRAHLPVAPRCNIQCNFCMRKFECVNETRPGVTSSVLKPFEAIRCRADAEGLLTGEPDIQLMNRLKDCASLTPNAKDTRPYVAAATKEGVLVNEHMGEARRLLIYEMKHGEAVLVDKRMTPKPGLPVNRWLEVAELIHDCRALLVSGIGTRPRQVLTDAGVEILEVGGLIDEAVSSVFTGKNINHMP